MAEPFTVEDGKGGVMKAVANRCVQLSARQLSGEPGQGRSPKGEGVAF